MTDTSKKFQDTNAVSIRDIFSRYDKIKVPDFQRDYSWNTDNDEKFNQVLDLWNDIIGKYTEYENTPTRDENKEKILEYLLGPMIFIKKEKEADIVDGQQRLSTLTMLICIVRDILFEHVMDNPDNVKDWLPDIGNIKMIENLTYTNIDDDEIKEIKDLEIHHKSWKLKMNKNDEEVFTEYVQKYKADSDDKYKKNEKDQFRRISIKIKEIKKMIQNEDKKNLESHKKIYQAYVFLYEKINEGLITKFTFNRDYETEKKNIRKKFHEEKFGTESVEERQKIMIEKGQIDEEAFEEYLSKERARNLGNLKKFLRKITENFYNILLTVEDDDDAFQVFETVNFRGKLLSKTNLIKNFIISKIEEEQRENFSKKWNDYLNKIDADDQDRFFRYLIVSRGDKDNNGKIDFSSYRIHNQGRTKLNKDNIFKIIKFPFLENNSIKDKKERAKKNHDLATSFITNKVQEDVKIYQFLKNVDNNECLFSNKEFEHIKNALNDLKSVEAEYIHYILMTAFRKWKDNTEEFIALVSYLTIFFIRFKTIERGSPSLIEKFMFQVCGIIENDEDIDKKNILRKIVKMISCMDDNYKFENVIKKENFRNDTAKIILERIEEFIGGPDMRHNNKLEVEHILPKKPELDDEDKKWDKKKFFHKKFEENVFDFPQEFNAWSSRLGNLTLLDRKMNNKVKNYNFQTKLTLEDNGYNSSKLRLNELTVKKKISDEDYKDILKWYKNRNLDNANTKKTQQEDWTASSIASRAILLYEISKLIWKLPKISCTNKECSEKDKDVNGKDMGIQMDEIDTWSCHKCGNEFQIKIEYEYGSDEPAYYIPVNLRTL